MHMIFLNTGFTIVNLIPIHAVFLETNVLSSLRLACPAIWEAPYLGLWWFTREVLFIQINK
jgi:hypothetical protein